MVSELLTTKLKNSIGLRIILFTSNHFRFEGKILGIDDEFIEIYDLKKFRNKLIKLSEITEGDIIDGS
jgi:hypothetical protein